jgi:hypothetical protein
MGSLITGSPHEPRASGLVKCGLPPVFGGVDAPEAVFCRPGDAFNPDRFVDPQGFKTSVEQLEKTYREQLARERAKTR